MQLNRQFVERRVMSNTALDIQEIFYTIQGEGPFSGHPAVFIRFAGCNLMCPGCDTDYTSQRKHLGYLQIINRVRDVTQIENPLIVITGGEPFRQSGIERLCMMLMHRGYRVQIETNGILSPSLQMQDWIADKRISAVVSPKTHTIASFWHLHATAFKYVLSSDDAGGDGLPIRALMHPVGTTRVARTLHECMPIYLSPMDEQDPEKNAANTKAVINSCMEHGYIMQTQMHKTIGVP